MRSALLTSVTVLLASAHATAAQPAPTAQTPVPADVPISKYGSVVGVGSGGYLADIAIVIGPKAVLTWGSTYCSWLDLGHRLRDRPDARLATKPAHLLPTGSACHPSSRQPYVKWVVVEYADALNLPIAQVKAPRIVKGLKDSFEGVYYEMVSTWDNRRRRFFLAHDGTRYGKETDGAYQDSLKLEEWAYIPSQHEHHVALLDVGSTSAIFYGFAGVSAQVGSTLGKPATRKKPWFYGELTPAYADQINAIARAIKNR